MSSPPDIIRQAINSRLNDLHTALPGIVMSYDPESNKATIQPALNKNYVTGVQTMPVLENVPVMFPNFVRFPVNQGDYVLLVFAERSLDLWLSVGGQVTPTDPRKFDLSDAIAIPGLVPFTETYPDNNNQDFVIDYAGSNIRINSNGDIIIDTSNKVAIGNSTTEVLDILSQLMTLLQGAVVMGSAFNGPLNPAFTSQVGVIQAQLDAIKGVIP